MFTPQIAGAQAKTTKGAISRSPTDRSALPGDRPGHDAAGYMLPRHRTIGNQAALRLLSQPVRNAAAPSRAAGASVGGAPVQRKPNGALASVGRLAVTEPGDRHETEADSVARTIDHAPPPMPLSPAGPPPSHVTPPGLTGGGSKLPRAVRDDFEQRFARPLDHVRIHTGGEAAVAACSLAARAFTVGSDIVFGRGEFAPDTGDGRRLLAHELTHVIQQASAGPRIARVPLDLDRVDTELRAGTPLTQTAGDVGFGSARGKPMDPPAEDTTLPIGAFVFPHTSASPTAKAPPAPAVPTPTPPAGVDVVSGASPLLPCAREQNATTTCKDDVHCLQARQAYLECVDQNRPAAAPQSPAATPQSPAATPQGAPAATPAATPAPQGGASATPAATPAPRALVIGSIHGDEHGPQALSLKLLTELSQDMFRRDFDTIFVPLMNPGGSLDELNKPGTGRNNRHNVDLNRNWPGLPGFKPFPGTPPPMQPEVKAVKAVIDKLQPSRILSMHAQGDPKKGGAFADPVEGEAREIACRMAMAMGGGDANDPANRLSSKVCESRYPASAEVEISEKQSSLGAWASVALKTPVITTEVPGKDKLPESGADRSVENIMPGLRDFFRDHKGEPSKADELLRNSITTTLLTGMPTAADKSLLDNVQAIVAARFQDMNRFYQDAWLPKHKADKPPPPAALTASQTRDFASQAGIDKSELAKRKITGSSGEADIRKALVDILGTMSMAGFSRHHWGTEIDLMGPGEVKHEFWEGSGKFVSLIPFVRDHAAQFGFFNPFSGGSARATPHYNDEPWHLSYTAIADVMEAQWLAQIQGKVLDDLIDKTADAIRGSVDKATMVRVLRSLQLEKFQANVAHAPGSGAGATRGP